LLIYVNKAAAAAELRISVLFTLKKKFIQTLIQTFFQILLHLLLYPFYKSNYYGTCCSDQI